MKKITKIFLASAMAFGFGFAAKAQIVNADMAVGATVMDQLTITRNEVVNFGNISANTAGDVYLSPTGTGSTFIGTSATVGKFTLVGSTGASVKVTWPASITLSTGGGGANETIDYDLLVHGKDTDDASTSASLGVQGTATTSNVTLTAGNYYLYVGGGFTTLPSAQVRGAYTGTANFTVIYN